MAEKINSRSYPGSEVKVSVDLQGRHGHHDNKLPFETRKNKRGRRQLNANLVNSIRPIFWSTGMCTPMTIVRRKLLQRRIERLPVIKVHAAANYYKAFVAPNPDFSASINNAAGDRVGTASYAVSPLFDRVYLFEIAVAAEHRRHGYATALLWYLAQTYSQPITAVKELHYANGFWSAARKLKEVGLVVTMPLSTGEMDDEAARWQHLRPEVERLEKIITERLTIHREPWHIAVGRGL